MIVHVCAYVFLYVDVCVRACMRVEMNSSGKYERRQTSLSPHQRICTAASCNITQLAGQCIDFFALALTLRHAGSHQGSKSSEVVEKVIFLHECLSANERYLNNKQFLPLN